MVFDWLGCLDGQSAYRKRVRCRLRLGGPGRRKKQEK